MADTGTTCTAEDCKGWVPWDQGSDYCGRCIVEDSGTIPQSVKDRARLLLEAWLRGVTQGGHTASPEDIAAVYDTSLARAREEASA